MCKDLTTIVIGSGVETLGEDAFGNCFDLETVYFKGTYEEWLELDNARKDIGDNYYLFNADVYFYSEDEPYTDDNYWHYDENGEIVVWGAEDIVEE